MSTVAAPTGGANDPLDGISNPTSILTLAVDSIAVEACQTMQITWTVENETDQVNQSQLSLIYQMADASQAASSQTPSGSITIAPISGGNFTWSPVWIHEPGPYRITALPIGTGLNLVINPSARFVLTEGDNPWCLDALSTSATGIQQTQTLPVSSSSPQPSESSSSSSSSTGGSNSKIGAIVGGTITACVLLAVLVGLLICRRRRQVIAKNAKPRSLSAKGHNRTWGGLSSIDKLQQGEIPVVVPAESPYAYRTRSHSTGRAMTEDYTGEKGYAKDMFPVDAELLAEMPTFDGERPSQRYSTDALSAVLRGYNDQHARNMVPTPAAPVVTHTTATFGGGDDPFSDTAFLAHGKRTSTLSVPVTARAPSQLSDISSRNTPSPLPSSAIASAPPSQPNTVTRNTSATASVPRPTRKPVPQYTEDSIELTKPSLTTPRPGSASRQGSSPTTLSPGEMSASSTSHGHLTDTSHHWLQDRVPTANRNIGLAGQGEGPVHYLIPDMPSPARD
ncbi:hypothetical protein FRC18_004149 [Serendipita sp. 400]|nr:hypothetical protein FRC18_004149 [Serendipita sp. 400]